jgi:UPF0176 protein
MRHQSEENTCSPIIYRCRARVNGNAGEFSSASGSERTRKRLSSAIIRALRRLQETLMPRFVIASLYRFVALEDFQALQQPLLGLMRQHRIKGTLLLAAEGINGTVAGSREAIDTLLAWLKCDPRLEALDHKESFADDMPFGRCKVKLKKEIVSMGVAGIDPHHSSGTYVHPQDWNALISDPDVLLIDTRNQYEIAIGSFKNAVNPQTTNFRQFPQYARDKLRPEQHKKIAMFCTGGIRCEKSTAYLKAEGFAEVYHLKGGILKYLEEVPEEDSLWQGECFVFDDRVTVNHQLLQGQYDQCHACRQPISDADKASRHYSPGVSCPHCIKRTSQTQRDRFAERQRQVRLAAGRGETHIGNEVAEINRDRKARKLSKKNSQRTLITAEPDSPAERARRA